MGNLNIDLDRLKTSMASVAYTLVKAKKSPDELFGELFLDVQQRKLYKDSKIFVDLVPRSRVSAIQQEYRLLREDPAFDLREFINRHFYSISPHTADNDVFRANKGDDIDKHINRLWDHLKRKNLLNKGSLIALPHGYIVPGGRFNEQYYWDSYFIMLGLAADGRWEMVRSMVDNFAFQIKKYGYIPTANRTYFLSRSQPPFFALMVKLLAQNGGKKILRKYLPVMVQEYKFWMYGKAKLENTKHNAYSRLVKMRGGEYLNRYYDNKLTPRPESLNEDTNTAQLSKKRQKDKLFLHLRAAAESGWDFSSRWLEDGKNLQTIHTADIIPIDLNCLLYELESTIAGSYSSLRHPILSRRYKQRSQKRKAAINKYLWSDKHKFYMDYNFHKQKKTRSYSLASVFPLYVAVASAKQASYVSNKLEKDFLKAGGLLTTLVRTGQQWDYPNGWAPLQWVAVMGLKRYGFSKLADKVKNRWLKTNQNIFQKQHKLVEKYNVVERDSNSQDGEYTLQDGFGWTNGVYRALEAGFNDVP